MKKRGVAVSVAQLAGAVAREYERCSGKDPGKAKLAVAGEGVVDDSGINEKKLAGLSENRLKAIYKTLSGKAYEED